MSHFVIPPHQQPSLPVNAADAVFPVRRVYCIGRNYAAHAIEMGHDPDREPPFFFQKNPENLIAGPTFRYPPQSDDVHHEVELLVALKSGGSDISISDALSHVYGYGVALDMTRRDLQAKAKKMGRPWEIGKAFEGSAPAGPIHPAPMTGHPDQGAIRLSVNGKLRQEGDLNQMIWKVPEMIAWLSRYFDLAGGDVILSGTPAGVGEVKRGDRISAEIEGIGALDIEVI